MAKKYFWLKLKDDFFNTKEIKKLRRVAGGDTYTVIYLKLQLLSLKNEGKLFFDGIEDTFVDELALEIDEDVENIRFTLMFLEKCGLMEQITEDEFFLLQAAESIGSETQGAERVRKFRKKESERKALLCNNNVIESNALVTNSNTEIEIEKDIELEIEKECAISKDIVSSNKLQPIIDHWNSLNLSQIKNIKGNRLKLLNTRIKEYSMEEVIQAIDSINQSSFLKGQNDTNWTITFDWFIKPNNFPKVLEGNYIKEVSNGSTRENIKQSEGKYTGFKVPKPKLTGKSECDDLI